MKVAMWLCAPLLVGHQSSLGLAPNFVVLDLGNEGGGPHHMQGRDTWGLWIGFKYIWL
jgi:hypothetical protein